ncbi:DUF3634 family protein [Agarivorans sp. Toyoura001]|uniref:DUF3634 family protein n=1 Tax=unclassified Agarivorans TaxID=2636026 RepID=UPI0010D34955|nr:DUF3634 family protein [Agarivorans sp. Toyoura001]GDY26894.1 hypothetical protein AHAT_27840 [Agarivorans sp. Toyoura001]
MTISIIIGLVALAVLVFRLRHIQYTFVCELRSGKVNVIKGHVPSSFIHDCRQMMRGRKVVGLVKGLNSDGKMHLRFSRSIAQSDQVHLEKQFPHKLYSSKHSDINGSVSLD